MTTPQFYAEVRTCPAASVLAHEHWELQSQDIPTSLTERREITDEEFVIEMRYQQALALANLEYLFAEGLLDCT